MRSLIEAVRRAWRMPTLSEQRERLLSEAQQQALEHRIAAEECDLRAEWHRLCASMFAERVDVLAAEIEGETASIRRVLMGSANT